MSKCYHCGDDCNITAIVFDDKNFCCNGCKTVYEIFQSNDLTYYYDLQSGAGTTPLAIEGKYDFLTSNTIAERLIEFDDGTLVFLAASTQANVEGNCLKSSLQEITPP